MLSLPLVPWTGLQLTRTMAESALPHAPVIADEERPARPFRVAGRLPIRRLRLVTSRA
jgi:hypothetical protein